MSPANETILVAAAAGFVPSLSALVLAIAGYIRGTTAQKQSAGNTRRLDKIENGGGDAKIDARLARHGLIDRRTDIDGPGGPAHPAPAIREAVKAGTMEAYAAVAQQNAAAAAVPPGFGLGGSPDGGVQSGKD